MEILWAVVIGLIAGALAKLIMPGRDPGGVLVTIVLGIGGALLATFIGRMAGWYEDERGAGLIAATLGAILILWLYRMMSSRRRSPVQ